MSGGHIMIRLTSHLRILQSDQVPLLFLSHTQAYVFDLEDEYAQSDIPTTLLRSRADCPTQEVTCFIVNCTACLWLFSSLDTSQKANM